MAATASTAPDARRPARLAEFPVLAISAGLPACRWSAGGVEVEPHGRRVALVGVAGRAVERDREAVAVLRAGRVGAERVDRVTGRAHRRERPAVAAGVVAVAAVGRRSRRRSAAVDDGHVELARHRVAASESAGVPRVSVKAPLSEPLFSMSTVPACGGSAGRRFGGGEDRDAVLGVEHAERAGREGVRRVGGRRGEVGAGADDRAGARTSVSRAPRASLGWVTRTRRRDMETDAPWDVCLDGPHAAPLPATEPSRCR